jgi:hypothetical protein
VIREFSGDLTCHTSNMNSTTRNFEDGVLQRNGTVKLAKSMNAAKVPATVQAVLASRIDRLPAEEKELLQTLAPTGPGTYASCEVRRATRGGP